MDKIIKQIQKDLDDGKYNLICSNETTFLNYVKKCLSEVIEKIKTDLIQIADEGEIEDLRREVERYFRNPLYSNL